MSKAQQIKNTDRELWRETDSYFAPSIHVTEQGGIGINVSGRVIVMPIRAWHALALASSPEEGIDDQRGKNDH